ncbi:hypothetical protein DXB21_13035, partial [Bacteroides faecis]|uniref:hypothetical protein n=1 Tax=Bacteroides faecis TaxID=674529 RepID=UPI000ED0545A
LGFAHKKKLCQHFDTTSYTLLFSTGFDWVFAPYPWAFQSLVFFIKPFFSPDFRQLEGGRNEE